MPDQLTTLIVGRRTRSHTPPESSFIALPLLVNDAAKSYVHFPIDTVTSSIYCRIFWRERSRLCDACVTLSE